MGACCTREQTAQINELENSVHYNAEEIINTGVDYLSKPELKFEIIKLKKSPEDIQLDLILNNIQNSFQIKTKKISLIEIYNLTIYFKDNYTQSEYLLFDMRRSAEQKEDFLKKMNHINYTYKQIKDMKDKKLENFRTFLDNKKIIFIISEKHLSKEYKGKADKVERQQYGKEAFDAVRQVVLVVMQHFRPEELMAGECQTMHGSPYHEVEVGSMP